MTKNWRAWQWCRLTPGILFEIIDLYVIDWAILRATSDKVNISIAVYANHRAVHRYGNISGTVPALALGHVGIHV